jgi:uncharacterized protein YbbC (DUF1343 family)
MKTGLDLLIAANFEPLHDKRVGLLTHPAAISGFNGFQYDGPTRSTLELFATHPAVNLVALFGPEHGLSGEAQDLIPVLPPSLLEGEGLGVRGTNPVRVHSLYGDTFDSLKPTPEMLDGLDVFVVDLQDVGARYYTFQATMLYCMEACAASGIPVWVLDRPNPIGHFVEGPTVHSGFESFIGVHPICIRHGMTIGELAKLYKAERVPTVELEVIECQEYDSRYLCNLSVSPSPNMPTTHTALVYPGMCLIEGTNLSEGRGTTRPFEYVGFPGVNPNEVTAKLRDLEMPWVDFLPATFRPTFQKHAGKTCGGVFIAPIQPHDFRSVVTGLAVLWAFRELLGDAFRWRTETYEFVSHIPAIDLLFGSDRERKALEAGTPLVDIIAAWDPERDAFLQRVQKVFGEE